MTVDKLADSGDVERCLRGLGLRVGEAVVRKVVSVPRGETRSSLYELYATRPGKPPPLCGKGTVDKIRRLLERGQLVRLLQYWGMKEAPEADPIQLEHLKALKKFLQQDSRIQRYLTVWPPARLTEWILRQLIPGGRVWLPVGGSAWEAMPIVKNLKSHCLEHQLWKDIDEWKRRKGEYRESTSDVATKLWREFRGTLGFQAAELSNPVLERNLLLDIFNWLAGQLLGNVPAHPGRFFAYAIVEQQKVSRDNIPGQIERAQKAAEEFLERWSDSDHIRSLVRRYHALVVLAQRIRDDIAHIDEAILAQGSCPNCSIADSVQGTDK